MKEACMNEVSQICMTAHEGIILRPTNFCVLTILLECQCKIILMIKLSGWYVREVVRLDRCRNPT